MGGILPGYPAPSSERRSLRRLPADGLNLEAQWVLAAQAGYTLAFDELVARNQDRIYRLAANITRIQAMPKMRCEALLSKLASTCRRFQSTLISRPCSVASV